MDAKMAKAAKPASRKKGKYSEDQNMFDFMEESNQRGIFDDLADKNLYEGEDLDVPSYLRRGKDRGVNRNICS